MSGILFDFIFTACILSGAVNFCEQISIGIAKMEFGATTPKENAKIYYASSQESKKFNRKSSKITNKFGIAVALNTALEIQKRDYKFSDVATLKSSDRIRKANVQFNANFVSEARNDALLRVIKLTTGEGKSIELDPSILQKGDLIFRRGLDTDSDVIAFLSDFRYSHVGAVVQTSPEVLIVHAVTAERGKNTQNAVIQTSLAEFVASSRGFALKRLHSLSPARTASIARRLKAQIGKPFVIARAKEPNLYCTTLLERAYGLSLRYDEVHVPVFGGKYLFPKAFWEIEDSELIFQSE